MVAFRIHNRVTEGVYVFSRKTLKRAEWGILRDLARRNFTVAKLWLLFADSRPVMPIQAHVQFAKCLLGLPKPIHTHSGLRAGFALTQEVASSSLVVPANLSYFA